MFNLNPRLLPFPLSNIYAHINEIGASYLAACLVLLFTNDVKQANEIFDSFQ